MAELKVGVIGCGGHARTHFEMINQDPRLHLAAIAELDETRLAQAKTKYEPPHAFQHYETMLDALKLDLVYVITQPAHQLAIVLACLARDLHTSIEKSPGMRAQETRQMLAAAEQSQGKAIVSFNRRYKPEVLAIRKLLQERGGAGQVSAIYHKPPASFVPPGRESFAPPAIVCDAIHHVDLLRWMAGRTLMDVATATEVYAQSWHGQQVGTPHYNAIVAFDNGCRGNLMSFNGVGYRIQRVEVHAEDMSAYLDLTSSPEIRLYLDRQLVTEPLDFEAVGGLDFNETCHFVDCILNDEEPWSPLADAVKTMELCEAIERGHLGSLNN